MGIRIHKCIGYGLDDVECAKYKITDKRFKNADFDELDEKFSLKDWRDSLLVSYEKQQKIFDETEHDGVPKPLSKKYRDLIFGISYINDVINKKDNIHLTDLVNHQAEFGRKDVVIFMPVSFKEYQRYDDLIDYCEERGGSMEPKVNILDFPIYPYENYMDKRNGESITYNAKSWMQHHKGKDSVKVPKEFFEGNDIKTLGEARENIVPSVPAEIAEFCDYMEIFEDKNMVYSLKPMIYTYWC